MEIERFTWRMLELAPLLAQRLIQYESNHFTSGKITLPQLWALNYLGQNGRIPMGELARGLSVSRPAATATIDRLIAQGMVCRSQKHGDRRVIMIQLTPRGRRVIQHIWKEKHDTVYRIFSKLSGEDRAQYVKILEQILKTFDTIAPSGAGKAV